MVFERLAHHFENVARKLRQLIEEEQAVVREGNFTGTRNDAAANEARVGDCVMWRAEGPLGHEALRCIKDAGDGVNLGGLESFFKAERREDGWQPAGRSLICCGCPLRKLQGRAWRCAGRGRL